MIEFKAECGHTVRAKDEDAGGLVRCSYCGRPANVPESVGDDLDFLFNDVQQGDEADGVRKKRKRGGLLSRRQRRTGEFNPFAVVLRLCYAALLISIVVVVGRKVLIPAFKEGGLQERVGAVRKAIVDTEPKQQRGSAPRRTEPSPPGLMAREKLVGLYVSSTPSGATVYCLESSKAPPSGRINKVKGCGKFRAGEAIAHLHDGVYVVEIVFPWNSPKLTSYANYLDFRKAIGRAPAQERNELAVEYFLPDEGSVFVDETEEQIYIVRQYRDVEVNNRRSKGVRALFLPRILKPDKKSFAIEEIVTSYAPPARAYTFDEKYVRGELLFYDVDMTDVPFVIEGLARIGVIPYITPDGNTRLFKIDIHDGSFAVRTISKPEP